MSFNKYTESCLFSWSRDPPLRRIETHLSYRMDGCIQTLICQVLLLSNLYDHSDTTLERLTLHSTCIYFPYFNDGPTRLCLRPH